MTTRYTRGRILRLSEKKVKDVIIQVFIPTKVEVKELALPIPNNQPSITSEIDSLIKKKKQRYKMLSL